MFKIYRLQRQLKKVTQSKLQEIQNQNFDLAATHRDKEKEILQKITALKKNGNVLRKLRLFLVYRHTSECLHGIYLQEKDFELPVYLPFYNFSRELKFYLESFFAEHPAFRFDWIEQPSKRRSMVKEVTEFYFLTEILDHFTNYKYNSGKDYCKFELNRSDLEAINHSNLFLKLFTLPIKHRKAFKNNAVEPGSKIIVLKDERNNPIGYYRSFHYRFPYEMKLQKREDSYVISSPFMKLKFHVNCCTEERLPNNFCRFICGFNKKEVPRIKVSINIYIKRFAYIYPKNWKQFRTINSLKKSLNESFSSDHYFNTHWKENLISKKGFNFFFVFSCFAFYFFLR